MFRAPPPERRRRRDLVAAAVVVVVLAALVLALAATSDIAGTTSRTADEPIAAPPPASGAPAAFSTAWEAAGPGAPAPVVAGPAVVTAEGSTVLGRDPRTGEERWSYTRDLPLCTVGAGFPGIEQGRVLAVYANDDLVEDPGAGDGAYCSELTMLSGDTGERVGARNPDSRPGTRLLADDTYVLATGTDRLEVWRSDLVRTLEYGTVPAQEQGGRQPRPDCTHGSAALGGRRVAVLERCPGEATDRLTVLAADGEDGAEQPEERFSVLLPGTGAVVVAVSTAQVAVALPDPARLVVLDDAGVQVSVSEVAGTVADPPGGVAATSADDTHRFWFTGSSVVALDATQLALLWTLPDALGPPVRYGVDLLVPVREGLRVVDAERGTPGRLLPVSRPDPDAPVTLAVAGDVLLEQRGGRVAALVPAA